MDNLIKLRIDSPPKLTGNENFEEFVKRFTNYMSLSSSRYGDLMRRAANNVDVIVTERLNEVVLEDEPTGTTRKFAGILFYVLVRLVDGSAYVLIDQIEDANGLEAWRRLHE